MVLRRWAAPQHIMDGASQKETSSPCSSACGASPPDRCCWLKESGFCLEHAGTTMKGGGFTSQSCLLGLAGCWHSQGRHLSILQTGALTTVWRKFSLSAFKSWGVTPQLLSNMCSACEITLVLYSPTFLWRWRSQVFGLRLLNTSEWPGWCWGLGRKETPSPTWAPGIARAGMTWAVGARLWLLARLFFLQRNWTTPLLTSLQEAQPEVGPNLSPCAAHSLAARLASALSLSHFPILARADS